MRDLIAYGVKCMEMLDKIGIEYGNIIEMVPNTRARKRWGQIKAIPGGYSININSALLDERNDDKGLINTILHELLHSVKGCMNHGENWKRQADKVYRAYGIEIKRTSSAEEKGVAEETRIPYKPRRIDHSIKYMFECTCCGQMIKRERASKFTKNPGNYKCAICGGKFAQIF